jgi:hypothetical protein
LISQEAKENKNNNLWKLIEAELSKRLEASIEYHLNKTNAQYLQSLEP